VSGNEEGRHAKMEVGFEHWLGRVRERRERIWGFGNVEDGQRHLQLSVEDIRRGRRVEGNTEQKSPWEPPE
jgi:hypothetical protein